MELLDLTLNTALIISYLGLFVVFAWRNLANALALIALLLPSYLIRFTIASVPFTLLECMILIVFFVWMLRDSRFRRINVAIWKTNGVSNAIPKEFRMPLALVLVSATLSAFLSPAQPASFGILKAYFIEPLLYLIVMAYTVRTRIELDRIMSALGYATIIIGSYALFQYLTGIGIDNPFWAQAETRRITTFFGYPNANSLFVAPIVAYYLGSVSKDSNRMVKAFSLLVILSGIGIVLMAKTAGAVLALGIVLWMLLYRHRRMRAPLISMTIIVGISLLIATPIITETTKLGERVSRDHLDLTSTSLEIRINQWRETLLMLSDRPLTGAGLANYQQALLPFHRYEFLEIYLYPHNLALNFWSELGLLGFVAILWLLIATARALYQTLRAHLLSGSSRALAWGLVSAWVVIVIHGLVDVPYFKNDLSVLWMLFVGATGFLLQTTGRLNERHTKSW